LILRNALFLNGILTNLEASYGLTDEEITQLEQMDESLMRTILECPMSVPREMLYLELGATPIRYILMCRRLMFYHYIICESDDSLIRTFYLTQRANPVKNDWCLTVTANLETLNIVRSESEIKCMSEYKFNKLVKSSIQKEAFRYLQQIKSSHSKVLHIQYDQLIMQKYLLPLSMPTQLAKFLFLSRTRMLQVGANFKGSNPNPVCPLCKSSYDSQNHLLVCPILIKNNEICKEIPNYDDLFCQNLTKMSQIAKILSEKYKKRTKMEKT
jgi:hypothetical protein